MSNLLTIILFIACSTPTTKSQKQAEVEFKEKVEAFVTANKAEYSTHETDSRFTWSLDKNKNHKWVKKTSFKSISESKTVDLFFYEYQDEPSLNAAYEALINCYPTDCMKLTEGQEKKALKTTPSIVIVNSKTIIVANTKCVNNESATWSKIKMALKQEFATESTKTISTGCGGSLKWS